MCRRRVHDLCAITIFICSRHKLLFANSFLCFHSVLGNRPRRKKEEKKNGKKIHLQQHNQRLPVGRRAIQLPISKFGEIFIAIAEFLFIFPFSPISNSCSAHNCPVCVRRRRHHHHHRLRSFGNFFFLLNFY